MPDFLDMLRFRPVFDVLLRTQGLEVSALTPKKTLEVPDGVCLSSSRMSPTIHVYAFPLALALSIVHNKK